MNSTDGVNQVPPFRPETHPKSVRPSDVGSVRKTAEDYVMIENRLAAQREQPAAGSPFDSIFDQLRGRLGK